MSCPYCGAPLSRESKYCTNCGYKVDEQPVQIGVPGAQLRGEQPGQQQATVGQQRVPVRQAHGYGVKIVVIVFFMLLAGTLAIFGIAIAAHIRAVRQPHPVTFMVNITNYDQESSRIPVRITGTDIDGNEVDQTIFLAHGGHDIELAKGRYQAEALGSPISSTGLIYHVPTTIINFTLGEDLDPSEPYTLPLEMAFEFLPIDPTNMTDQQIDEALAWARKDEASGVDVGKLEAAAKALQQSAEEPSVNKGA